MKARFEKIYIEISDYCGLACGFCPSAGVTKRRGIMDLALFRQLCAQVQNQARRVCLHILGDPLSVRELDLYVEILRGYGLCVELVSSGLFLQERHFELLTQKPFIQVAFSLSAFVANDNLLKTQHLEQILKMCAYNIAKGSPIFVNLRFHSNDIMARSPKFMELCAHIACFFGMDSQALLSGLQKGRVRLGTKVFANPKTSFVWEQDEVESRRYDSKRVFCHGANKQFGILSNGEVVPCCIDYRGMASFGNARTQRLDEILQSKAFRDFATALKEGYAPSELCQKCGYRLMFD